MTIRPFRNNRNMLVIVMLIFLLSRCQLIKVELLWAMAMAKIEGRIAKAIEFKTYSLSVVQNSRAFRLQEMLANTSILEHPSPVTHFELR